MAEQEFVIVPPSDTDVSKMALLTDIQFLDPYGSESINRKFFGIVPPGIYRGFKYALPGAMKLRIGLPSEQGTAVVQCNSVCITVQQSKPVDLNVPAGFSGLVVLTGFYKFGVPTKQVSTTSTQDAAKIELIAANALKPNQVILYTLNVPAGTTVLTSAMISLARRQDVSIAVESDIYQLLKDHISSPTAHTKAQVGLSLVNNWPATAAVNDSSDAKYATAGAVKKAYDLANAALPRAGGDVGRIKIKASATHITLAGANGEKPWHMETNGAGALRIVETGVKDHLTILPGGNATFGANLTAAQAYVTGAQSSAANALTRRDFVLKWSEDNARLDALKQAGVYVGGTVKTDFNLLDVGSHGLYSSGPDENKSANSPPVEAWGGSWVGLESQRTFNSDMLQTTLPFADAKTISFRTRRTGTFGEWISFYSTAFKPTRGDVGLGNVQNWPATAAVNDASDAKYATAGAVKKAYDLAATKLAANANAVSASKWATARTITLTGGATGSISLDGSANVSLAVTVPPTAHTHTPAQVGLGNVPNWPATAAVNDASDTKFATAGAVKKTYDLAAAALPRSGGDLFGKVKITVKDALGTGNYGLDMVNGSIGGLNQLAFADPCESTGEGIYFPKTGKLGSSTAAADYDVFKVLDGLAYLNGSKFYTESNKPTRGDVGLGNVQNWPATAAVNDASDTKFATAGAVKKAYDLAAAALPSAQADIFKNQGVLGNLNVEAATKPGFFTFTPGAAGAPVSTIFGHGLIIANGRTPGRDTWYQQLVFGHDSKIYTRRGVNGYASDSWARVFTTDDKPTRGDVGLGNVPNWPATAAVNDASDAKFATAGAVKKAYDLANAALPTAGGEMLGDLIMGVRGIIGARGRPIIRDFGNGNVVLSASAKDDAGAPGDLYLGYNNAGAHVTNTVRLESKMTWKSVRELVDSDGMLNPAAIKGGVRPGSWMPNKGDVGLGNVQNWPATAAVNDASDAKYATAGAVKKAYDLAATKLAANANAVSASKWATARTITLTGGATGSVSLDGSENVSLVVTVPPTAHTHTPAQVGLGNVQNWPATAAVNDASDAKYATAGAVKKAYDLAATKLAANANAVSASKWATARTITLTGGATGSVSLDGSANVSLAVTVPPTAHTHTPAQVGTYSQGEIDNKVNDAGLKTVTIQKPAGLVDGKFYPVLITQRGNGRQEIYVETRSSGGADPMNCCSFHGTVRSSGWSDKMSFVDGMFTNHHSGERAIHSIWMPTETEGAYAIYVEARAFPLSLRLPIRNDVACTGADITYGTTTFKAGIDDPSGATVGTKASLGADFSKGNSRYHGSSRYYTEYFKPSSNDVGLGNVQNWPATAAVNDASDAKYATAGAVKKAYDLAATKLAANANAVSASKWATARTITLTGGATGSVSLDGSANVSLAVTVPPTAHTHTPAQVGLGNVQNWPATSAVNDASDTKYATAGAVKKAYDLAATKLAANANAVSASKWATARTITLTGGATGSVSLDGSENVSLAVTVPPTAHTHTPAQVGLGNVPNWPATAAVNDASDAKFATAGAVKKAYDLAASKANAAHDHAGSIVTPITLGKEDLNTIVKPGVYAQHANANTSAAQHYPENQAGSLTVTIGAGIQQRYHVYNSTRVYTRAQYDKGAFSPWALQYTTTNRPSPNEIGAAPAAHGHSPAEVGLSNLVNKGWNYAAVADTYAVRDGQGDLHARLFRATFPDQGDFGGAIAFRYNNQGDSYTRYCNNPAAVRNWLGVSSHQRLAATQVGGSIPASDGAAINLYRDVRGYSGLTIVEQNGFTQYLYFQWPHADCVFQVQLGNDHGIFQLYNNGTALKRLHGWAEHSAWHSWWIMT